MKQYKFLSGVVFAALFGVSSNTIAATALFNGGGELVGLGGVNVTGFGLYDLFFNDTWQGNVYDQNFTAVAGAALLSEFTGSGAHQGSSIDYMPSLAVGCESTILCSWQTVHTLMGTTNIAYGFFNNWDEANDVFEVFSNNTTGVGDALLGSQVITWLDWRPSKVSPVPVPAAVLLFAPALLGFLGFRRKISG